MLMRKMRMLAGIALVAALPFPASAGNAEVVQEFVAAFNAQDVERMLAVAHEEIEWFYVANNGVEGSSIHRETSGKAELRKAMTEYFASCPSCRSTVEIGNVHGDYLSAVETAYWTVDGSERSQSSLVVYQFEDGKIRRAWYFPAS